MPPCPTGAIDQWRKVLRVEAYTVAEQFAWDAAAAPNWRSDWRRRMPPPG
jgi:hypothetical protein